MQQFKRIVVEKPCFLSVWDWENPVREHDVPALGPSRSNVTANPSREVKGNLGLSHIPSCLSALLKYSLQKINYTIAARHNPEFVSVFTT
jgi:hypothetical protein